MREPIIDTTGDKQWPCRLSQNWEIWLPRSVGDWLAREYEFGDSGRTWVRAGSFYNCSRVSIAEGYTFDGCSCWRDGHRLPACLLHDALRQAVIEDCQCPWTRADADRAFDWALGECGVGRFERWMMYRAVAGLTGRLYSALKRYGSPSCGRASR